eukprot:TRINITY_DN11145_c0_g1_i2.p1 TRINITY_DN11145_c0_g1~~TRINITY_DN11145_c0_g1_i2.p1  ORF type:complete len:575 (+),score=69.51 TRINITY_DN11145_c0_g1_i2:65-1789(+)
MGDGFYWSSSNIKKLIDGGVSVHQRDAEGQTALARAVMTRDSELVHYLLSKGADPCMLTSRGLSPVHHAALNGRADFCDLFIERGASFYTPLHELAFRGDLEKTKEVYEKYKNHEESLKNPPIFYAIGGDHLEILEWMVLEKGIPVSITNQYGNTTMMCASWNGRLNFVSWLHKHGANMNTTSTDGWSSILLASWFGQVDVVKYLVENGANILQTVNGRDNALMCAALNGHLKLVEYLVKAGIDVNLTTERSENALFYALENEKTDVALWLIENSANVNLRNTELLTPLMLSCSKGNLEVAKKIIEKDDSSLLQVDTEGYNAFLNAIISGNLELTKWLFDRYTTRRKSFYVANNRGFTPLIMASELGHRNIVEWILQEKIEDIDVVNNAGETSIMCATITGHTEVAKYLLDMKADVNKKDSLSEYPLSIAIRNPNFELVKYFCENGANDCDSKDFLFNAARSERDVLCYFLKKYKYTDDVISEIIEDQNMKYKNTILYYHQWSRIRLIFLGHRDPNSILSSLPYELIPNISRFLNQLIVQSDSNEESINNDGNTVNNESPGDNNNPGRGIAFSI